MKNKSAKKRRDAKLKADREREPKPEQKAESSEAIGDQPTGQKQQRQRPAAIGDGKPKAASGKPPAVSGDNSSEARPSSGWLLQCPPGLARTMKRELNYVGAIAREQKTFDRLQRNHDLMFVGQAKDEAAFEKSRVAEMILKCPAYGRYKISKRQLQIMADEVKQLGPRRLVVSVAGRHFTRQDLGRFLARELETRGALIEDGIEEEVWMFCIDQDWYFGIPVKKARDIDGREAREEERRGSLPPPVAAALAFASLVRNDDVVLDPTCGSGTLLSEIHAYAPSAHLIGFDIDPKAVKIAKANLKHVIESELHAGDARTAKLETPNVTLTIANLPFGKQFGAKTTNAELYTELIAKSLSWRDPGRAWRGVFLTSDNEAFAKAAKAQTSVKAETLFKVKIRGELATAYRLSATT